MNLIFGTVTDTMQGGESRVEVRRMDGVRKSIVTSKGNAETTAATIQTELSDLSAYPLQKITLIDGTVIYDPEATT